MNKAVNLIVSVLILSVYCFSQVNKVEPLNTEKAAGINSQIFYDKELGITEIIEANRKLNKEFATETEELRSLTQKIEILGEELKRLASLKESPRISSKTLSNKINEHDSLVAKRKQKQNKILPLYEKRKAEIFDPINKKIEISLGKYAKQNDYTIVIDYSDCSNENSLIGHLVIIDITKAFVEHYNKSN